jgi:hypothetical protein
MSGVGDWTPDAQERLLALVFISDPWWYWLAVRVLAVLPGTGEMSERLDDWHTARAVRLYRKRPKVKP